MAVLAYKRPARKALKAMDKATRQRVMKALSTLANDPHDPFLDTRALVNRPGFRLRVGSWRALYRLEDDQVVVLEVLPRGGAYKVRR